ncbi:MAG: exodeoxyribonuclease VII large subunit, partial [Halobacillus sp.]
KQQGPGTQINETKDRLNKETRQLQLRFQETLNSKKDQFHNHLDKLTLLNPLEIMKRGYAIPFKEDGNVVKELGHVKEGSKLALKVHDGTINCEVLDVEEDEE